MVASFFFFLVCLLCCYHWSWRRRALFICLPAFCVVISEPEDGIHCSPVYLLLFCYQWSWRSHTLFVCLPAFCFVITEAEEGMHCSSVYLPSVLLSVKLKKSFIAHLSTCLLCCYHWSWRSHSLFICLAAFCVVITEAEEVIHCSSVYLPSVLLSLKLKQTYTVDSVVPYRPVLAVFCIGG